MEWVMHIRRLPDVTNQCCWSWRFPFRAILLTLFSVMLITAPLTAKGEPQTSEERIRFMAEQSRLVKIYRQLDYAAAELLYLQTLAILGTYGGWETVQVMSGNDTYRLYDRTSVIRGRANGLGRGIDRNRAVSEVDAAHFKAALASFYEMADSGLEIATLLKAGKVDAANILYRDRSRSLWQDISRSTYTLIDTAERNIAKTARGL